MGKKQNRQHEPGTSKASRRQFLKLVSASGVSALVSTPVWGAQTLTNAGVAPTTANDTSVLSPATTVAGQCESRIVPDTVDLVRHAHLAINAMSRSCDPDEHDDTYFTGNFVLNPPRLVGPPHYFCKYYESLALMRLMTGSKMNVRVDDEWARRADYISRTVRGDTVDGGRILEMLALFYHLTKDDKWLTCGNRIVDRWRNDVVVNHDDFAFFPHEFGNLVKKPDYSPGGVLTGFPGTAAGWALQGLSVYYRETRYEPAGDLAGRLAKYVRYHAKIFSDQGHFLAAHDGYLGPKTAIHFHHNSNCALALTEYALATGEKHYAEFAGKCYEYGRSVGNPIVGYFPEYVPHHFPDDRHGVIDCEGCDVADMTALALKLTQAGVGDYWDDADHYVRNMLTEMHLKSSRWVYESVKHERVTPLDPKKEDEWLAIQRLVGCFAGWSGPNEFRIWGTGVMACCTGNCSRALYYTWNHMVQEEPGRLTLELMLNRDCATAMIKSELPHAGQLNITVKKPCHIRIRKPKWLDPASVKVSVIGERRKHLAASHSTAFRIEGPFLVTDKFRGGTEVQVAFDLPQHTVKTLVGYVEATLTLRGNEVVSFDPPGKVGPYWQNKQVVPGIVPQTERGYFVMEHEVPW